METVSIRVGITDGNREFFERFHLAMKEAYSDEIEVYLFPTLAKALKAVERFHVRVVLLEPSGLSAEDYPEDGLPKSAYFARLSDRKQDEKDWIRQSRIPTDDPFEDVPILCRFRSVAEWHDVILREALGQPETADKALSQGTARGGASEKKTDCHVVLFTSAAGGVGTSTVARAFSECCVRHHRRALYLDLQTFPDLKTGERQDLYTLEDILLAVRGRQYTPNAILERALQERDDGIMTILPPRNPTTLFDVTGEELVTMLDIIKESKRCSVIVVDMNFDATEKSVLPFMTAELAVLVSNGTNIANRKTKQLMKLLPALCMEDTIRVYEKTCLLYNRYRQSECETLQTEAPIKLGGIGELTISDRQDLQAELAVLPPMERLYERLGKRGE